MFHVKHFYFLHIVLLKMIITKQSIITIANATYTKFAGSTFSNISIMKISTDITVIPIPLILHIFFILYFFPLLITYQNQ